MAPEESNLYRLIYISLASPDLEIEDYANILNVARAVNKRIGATGVLVYNGMHFMQLLEGPQQAVIELYSRIAKDSRHHGVVGIYGQEAEHRILPDWSMGYIHSPLRGNSIEAIKERNKLIEMKLPDSVPPTVRDMFANFNSLSER